MRPRTNHRRPDILSPDEEAILAVLREIAAEMRDRGAEVTIETFGAAVIAAGAARTVGSDGAPRSAFALGGVKFMVREPAAAPGAIEVAFLADLT